ncbi:hypothetical protein [Mucilaginibacter dorajii]|uniref:hypothetical protein n=1 Tax=Mucilaginibacter dorajii TaxID=692994 RepID=UPI0021676E44|nr:hypothetical protein [Mucilaginibacter dorajii]MCS3736185.1 hypothetical protein [Mucilaginibacter dorajii]
MKKNIQTPLSGEAEERVPRVALAGESSPPCDLRHFHLHSPRILKLAMTWWIFMRSAQQSLSVPSKYIAATYLLFFLILQIATKTVNL